MKTKQVRLKGKPHGHLPQDKSLNEPPKAQPQGPQTCCAESNDAATTAASGYPGSPIYELENAVYAVRGLNDLLVCRIEFERQGGWSIEEKEASGLFYLSNLVMNNLEAQANKVARARYRLEQLPGKAVKL